MVHLIHRKQVPLLHNTVFILCDEGDGLVPGGREIGIILVQLYTEGSLYFHDL